MTTTYQQLPSSNIPVLLANPRQSFGVHVPNESKGNTITLSWGAPLQGVPEWIASTHPKADETSTYRVVLNTLSQVSRVYSQREPDDVIAFLQRHTSLLLMLSDAIPHLQSAFGDGVRVVLEVNDDAESGIRQLVAWIQTTDSPEVALRKLDAFDSAWWLDQLTTVHSALLYHIEYA